MLSFLLAQPNVIGDINMSEKQKRVLFTAFSASAFYGAWAYFSNAGADNVWSSTLLQLAASFMVGLFMSLVIEAVYVRTSPPFQFVAAAIAPFWLALCAMYGLHWLLGTYKIIQTLLPNAVVGTLYFMLYVHKLGSSTEA